ncbi:MAG: hypothetical protein AABW59_03690 [archaeon]
MNSMIQAGVKPTGRERVDSALTQASKSITALKKLKKSAPTESKQKRIIALNERISKKKKKLVFLTLRARDPVTKYFASNALKEIAEKLKD